MTRATRSARRTNSFGRPAAARNGTLDTGFFYRPWTTGPALACRANAISGNMERFGSTQDEILARSTAQFGEGTNLDILWRCIYRNSLSLNDASSSLGELDFTEGSGWMYIHRRCGTYPSSAWTAT